MHNRPPVHTNRLKCIECGRVSRENERGWIARPTYDDEEVVYCSECDEREFAAHEVDASTDVITRGDESAVLRMIDRSRRFRGGRSQ